MPNGRVTNAVLYEMIKSIKEDTTAIKSNDKEQWKAINKNSQYVAGIKGAAGIIAGLVSMITAGIITYFFKEV
uniref:Uncharacterized protein n=1 Tax=viral metagenome TaxID=1070528 RepID=A0A6M3L2S8_9ZZZZ